MSGKLIMMILLIYIVLGFLGSTFEQQTTIAGTWAGNTEGGNTLSYLFDVRNAVTNLEVPLIEIPIPVPNEAYFAALFKVVLLRFSFLVDNYEMIWWIFFMPIAMMGIISMVTLALGIIQGNITWS